MQIGRKISLGPKGLAVSQGTASITVSAHNVQHEKEAVTPGAPSQPNDGSSILAKQIRASLRKKPSQRSLSSQPAADSISLAEPIEIPAPTQRGTDHPRDPASLMEEAVMDHAVQPGRRSTDSIATTPKAVDSDVLDESIIQQADATSPWLALLNPCNPRSDNMQVASQFRQWQNIFPSEVSSGAFKWDSILTPAILPLMTESRVSVTSLERRLDKKVRRLIATSSAADLDMQRMIAWRLMFGFQIVPNRTSESSQLPSESIGRILLSRGDLYHEVHCLSDVEIQVSEYERAEQAEPTDHYKSDFAAKVKPFAARREREQTLKIDGNSSAADWSSLDDQVVNGASAGNVGQAQARFVLIPVELPRLESHQRSQARELSDEERRIDGIQRLTQLWQRNRYFADEDERHKSTMNKPKTANTIDRDPNPLAIEYQTRDPSTVVTAYGGNPTSQMTNGEATIPLFAESERYHSSNFDMVKLVKQLQEPPPVGVELRDRRWFTRLHLKCFRGDEMTNWLVGVFKDLETREEAVALGNELMNKDIFTHVRGKHEFRDGNYFYQIRSAHRTVDYPDTAGLFTKGIGRSVPSTPIADFKHSPIARPAPSDLDLSSKDALTPQLAPIDSGRKEVLLSQVLQYNVDPTKKSSQLEVVNLHYGMQTLYSVLSHAN